MGRLKRNLIHQLSPILIGIFGFQLVVGSERLNPLNIGWLSRTGWLDGWGAYLGWANYRNSTSANPLGIINSYGGDFGNSLVYTDSIPLVSIPLKFFSPILPDNFQFFGVWLLLCFVTQSVVAWNILDLIKLQKLFLFCGTIILTFSPILLHRLNMHMSQAAHFLILCAIYLTIKKQLNNNLNLWFILLIISALVHPYFLVINFLFFITNFGAEIRHNLKILTSNKFRIITYITSLIFLMWQSGYFVAISSASGPWLNYLFKMDLLQPINFTGGSWIFSQKSALTIGNQEGYNFLGFGIILLLFICMFKWKPILTDFQRWKLNYSFIYILLLFFTLYSITYQVTIARHVILEIPLNNELKNLMSTFRASGRFFAPVYYFIIITCFYWVSKYFRNNYRVTFIIFALLLQVLDSNFAWRKIDDINLPYNQFSFTPIKDNRWGAILRDIDSVNVILNKTYLNGYWIFECKDWARIGLFVAQNKLSTNCAYSARLNRNLANRNQNYVIQSIKNATPENDSIYVLTNEDFRMLGQKQTLTGWRWINLDGFWVWYPLQG